jgi:hypothetical protein
MAPARANLSFLQAALRERVVHARCVGPWVRASQAELPAVNVAKAYKSNLDDGGVVASTSRGSGHPDQIEEEIRLSLVPPSFDEVLARGSASNNLGIKLDTIIQHIRALREEDPLAKIVLFSAWTEALRLCCSVFEHSGIRYVTLDKAKKNQISAAQQFQSNPEVAVFVLHSQSQAAGLNLTAAKTIVMCVLSVLDTSAEELPGSNHF